MSIKRSKYFSPTQDMNLVLKEDILHESLFIHITGLKAFVSI